MRIEWIGELRDWLWIVLFSTAMLLVPQVYAGDNSTKLSNDGPFHPTRESLTQYKCPDWFRNAKFGIWSVWGPQSVPEQGDWYARKMYIQGEADYKFHLAHYGHPSTFGYKDIIALWKAENWDPARLMQLYKRAGAKYFVVMANHHDGYDLWNSKYQPRWNSVNSGPHKDIVGLWRAEALKNGLRFGVTEHLGPSFSWFQVAHGSDKTGPLAGVPYDGADPQYQDLYHPLYDRPYNDTAGRWYADDPAWSHQWYERISDLVDTYQPDLLYTDGGIPFGEVGRALVAHFYNANITQHGGNLEAVYNHKDNGSGEFIAAAGVQDVERGGMAAISPLPWQTDTCIGDWFYQKNIHYRTAGELVHTLADIVSKNGNLLLNAPLSPDGKLDPEAEQTLIGIGHWLDINGEAIYGTRPFKTFGEGPTKMTGGKFNEGAKFTAQDIRFTTKGEALYAIVLGAPNHPIIIQSLGKSSRLIEKPIANISLLGSDEKIKWSQNSDALVIQTASHWPSEYAAAFKITFGS